MITPFIFLSILKRHTIFEFEPYSIDLDPNLTFLLLYRTVTVPYPSSVFNKITIKPFELDYSKGTVRYDHIVYYHIETSQVSSARITAFFLAS